MLKLAKYQNKNIPKDTDFITVICYEDAYEFLEEYIETLTAEEFYDELYALYDLICKDIGQEAFKGLTLTEKVEYVFNYFKENNWDYFKSLEMLMQKSPYFIDGVFTKIK